MNDNDNAPYPFLDGAVTIAFEYNEGLRGLLDVAKIAVGEGMPQVKASEALLAVRALLAVIDRNMPPDLQALDRRVTAARQLERDLVSLLT